MPKLNIYEQQYKASTPRATSESFGAMEGRAEQRVGQEVDRFGKTLSDIGQKRQARLDGINTAMAFEKYRTQMDEEFATTQATANFADPKVLEGYTQRAQELASEMVSTFEGSEDARNRLAVMLEQQRGQYARGGYETHVKEGYAITGKLAQNRIDTIAAKAKAAPEMLSEHLNEWYEEFAIMKDALPPQMEDQFINAGISTIAQSVYGSLMDTGDFEGAISVLDQPGIAEAMGGDNYRRLRTEARALQYDATKKQREIQADIDLYTSITDEEPTNPMVAQKLGMYIKDPAKTPGQTVRDSAKLLGITQESNPRMWEKLVEQAYGWDLGLGGESENPYGKSQTGLAYSDMSRLFGLNDRGMVSEQDKRRFIESAHLFATSGDKDPVTGERREKPLPPHFARLRDQYATELGIDLGQQTVAGPTASRNTSVVPVTEEPNDPVAIALNIDNDPASKFTVAQISTLLTGPRATAESTLEGFFGTESLVSGEAERQYQQWLSGFGNNIKAALRQNPRVTEGELQRLDVEFDLSGSFMQGEEGYVAKLAGVDLYLVDKIKQATTFLTDTNATTEMKKWARDTLPILTASRDKLGIVRVESFDDVISAYDNGMLVDGQRIIVGKGKDFEVKTFYESTYKSLVSKRTGESESAE